MSIATSHTFDFHQYGIVKIYEKQVYYCEAQKSVLIYYSLSDWDVAFSLRENGCFCLKNQQAASLWKTGKLRSLLYISNEFAPIHPSQRITIINVKKIRKSGISVDCSDFAAKPAGSQAQNISTRSQEQNKSTITTRKLFTTTDFIYSETNPNE